MSRPVVDEPDTPTFVPVLFEDQSLVVVDKPAGLPIHATARYQRGTLVARLCERFGPGVEPVHRLDRETSGLVICARSPEISRMFMHAFQRGLVHKEYLSVCHNHPREDAFTVSAPIAARGVLVRIAVHIDFESGRAASTRFEVLSRFVTADGAPMALLRAFPATGRQHQIRIHLSYVGCPVVGDKLYGPGGEAVYDRFSKRLLTEQDWTTLRLPRQALHAHRLRFTHPVTRAPMEFEAPMPADMAQTMVMNLLAKG